MLLSSRLPLSSLIELCRVVRHYLGSGLTVVDVFQQQAERGTAAVRPLAARVCQHLEKGDDLARALEREKASFPPLFVALARVGEETGSLPEVLGELEKYFLLQQRLRGQLLGLIAWPVLQFNAALFVLAGMLWILGLIAESQPGTKPLDPLGLGLTGTSGALIFLGVAYGSLAALYAVYLLATRWLRQRARVDAFFLRLPAVGPCLRALALTRFCLGLRLTLDTGMSIVNAVRLSLRATGNAAFVERSDVVLGTLRRGEDLTLALTAACLFPDDFLHMVAVAEESGRLTEVLRHQTDHYEQESQRRLTMLSMLASFAVWLLVAALIIVAIFRIALFYLSFLDPSNYGL